MSAGKGSLHRSSEQQLTAASWGNLSFPTPLHEEVANRVGLLFEPHRTVDTVLVVNSCARGRAISDSDLDLAVLVKRGVTHQDAAALGTMWQAHRAADPLIQAFERDGRLRPVHLDIFDGRFTHKAWDDGGGPDAFEVEIGNRIAHSVPLRRAGERLLELQAEWLPYYSNELRRTRLQMVYAACLTDLDRVEPLVRRDEGFSALWYLNKAFQEFLQALFIARGVYPLSYSKGLREQVATRLRLPELYCQLPPILSIRNVESQEAAGNAAALRTLLEHWASAACQ